MPLQARRRPPDCDGAVSRRSTSAVEGMLANVVTAPRAPFATPRHLSVTADAVPHYSGVASSTSVPNGSRT